MRRKPVAICAMRARSTGWCLPAGIGTVREKCAAAEALGKIGDAKAIPVLIKLFRDSSKIVRETPGSRWWPSVSPQSICCSRP